MPARMADLTFDALLPRDTTTCVTCSDETPACPSCPTGQSCQVTVPLTCTECPRSYCAANLDTTTTTHKSSSHPSAGAIAGGVIGGVAVIAIATYLVWRFCIKTRRQEEAAIRESMMTADLQKAAQDDMSFAARRDQRASTHTVQSIASTVFTRASNIIQIAYIPGVMNRASPSSPTVLVPPVPPIPIAINGTTLNTPNSTDDQHFFVPGDLRDSTYSGYSAFTDRTSYARTSYAPRSSIASTIYGKNAVIVAPPQTGMRAKPTMVDLKSPSAPPVPNVDYEKYNHLRPVSDANSTFSVGSTFLNNASAHTATPVRPVVVRVGNGTKKSPLSNVSGDSATASAAPSIVSSIATSMSTTPNSPYGSEKTLMVPSPMGTRPTSPTSPTSFKASTSGLGRESKSLSVIEDSPSPDQGPFADPPATPSISGSKNTASLNAVIEEATRRASSHKTSRSSVDERGRSPFGDEHATPDN